MIGHCAGLLTLQAFLIMWICRYFIFPTLLFYRYTHAIAFCVLAVSVVSLCSWAYVMLIAPSSFTAKIYWQIVLANLNGIFIIAVMLIKWDAHLGEFWEPTEKRRAVWRLALALLCTLLFMNNAWPAISWAFVSVIIVCIFCTAQWQGNFAGSRDLFLVTMLVIISGYIGSPFFQISTALPDYILQCLLCIGSVLVLPVV